MVRAPVDAVTVTLVATLRLAATETVMAPAGVVDALRAAGVTYAQAFLTHMCRVSTCS